jgi:anti-sigma regulatory factor (Ser/Thr protein kinase)
LSHKDRPLVALPPLEAPATPQVLTHLHAYVQEFWEILPREHASALDERFKMLFVTGVAEIASNIVEHAYKAATSPGPLEFHLCLYVDRVEGKFTDRGITWSGQLGRAVPSDVDVSQLPEGGRGLHIAQVALDELRYWRADNGVNHWLAMKRFPV